MTLPRRKFLSTSTKSAVAISILRSPLGAFAQSAAVQPVFARLDEFIARHMREQGAPGLTLALANRDGLIRVSTYGYPNTKAGLRVVPETMFEIGSISKSFVSLALLQCRDEGKLDLNKPIVEYPPWLKINSKFAPITTHHLLSHTAGLPGAPVLLDALLAELWTAYEPGKHFLYSNTGYNILGFLLEAIDKRPFAEALRARMLTPLGMTASAPIITSDLRRQMAIGYEPLIEDKPYPSHGPLGEVHAHVAQSRRASERAFDFRRGFRTVHEARDRFSVSRRTRFVRLRHVDQRHRRTHAFAAHGRHGRVQLVDRSGCDWRHRCVCVS